MQRIAAAGIALGALLLPGSALGATTSPEPCEMLTADDLEGVLDVPFEVLFTDDRTICSWASAPGAAPLGVTVTTRSLGKRALAGEKRHEREQPGAVVVRGVGDLAVASTQTTSPSTTDTILTVFDGRDVVGIVVTASEEPSRRQLRRLGTKALSRS